MNSIDFFCKVGNRNVTSAGMVKWSDKSVTFNHLIIRSTDDKESAIQEALLQFENKLREALNER